MRWIISASRARPGKSFPEKLANELMDAATFSGAAFRRREEAHRMAEANALSLIFGYRDHFVTRRPIRFDDGFKGITLEQFRNIGIIARIDAGKTTTTERIFSIPVGPIALAR